MKAPVVNISFTGEIKHYVASKGARPIKGSAREKMKELFEHGEKPSKMFATVMMNSDKEARLAGNYDEVGRTTAVCRKIASESRQKGRLDKNQHSSLMLLKSNMQKTYYSTKAVPGFIQDIGLDPLFVHYFSHKSILLWVNLARHQVALMDATRNVVRPLTTGKKLLYYEISFPNPSKGGSTIPIAGMLTSDQSEPRILNFIRTFQYAERQVRKTNVQPVLFNTDWGLAILCGLMKQFNRETMKEYISRCWRIVSGKAEEKDLQKTVFHICLSHHMKIMKKHCLNLIRHDFNYGMYMISLLLNCNTWSEAEEIWHDMTYILLSEKLTTKVIECSTRIQGKIESFDTKCHETDSGLGVDEANTDDSSGKTYKDEERNELAGRSKFQQRAKEILETVRLEVSDDQRQCSVHAENNKRYSIPLAEKLLSNYINTYPLWSNIMLGDLKRHSNNYQSFQTLFSGSIRGSSWVDRSVHNPSRTTSCQEQSFSVLKHIYLKEQTNLRIDDFSVVLKEMYFSMQEKSAVEMVRGKGKSLGKKLGVLTEECTEENISSKITKKCSVDTSPKPTFGVEDKSQLKEKWQKSGKIPFSGLPNKLGKFQQKPAGKIPLIKAKIKSESCNSSRVPVENRYCGMPNLGQTCWLNSLLQCLCHSKFVSKLFVRRANMKICVEDSSSNARYQLIDVLIKIWTHMRYNGKTDVPESYLGSLVYDKGILKKEFKKVQCDPSEFVSVYSREFEGIGVVYEQLTSSLCCDDVRQSQVEAQTIFLSIPDSSSCLVKDLLENEESAVVDRLCPNCNHSKAKTKLQLQEARDTLLFVLKRYRHDGNVGRTISTEAFPMEYLTINISGHKQTYELKSVVCHYGSSLTSGHYISYVIDSSNKGCKMLVKCNDKEITSIPFPSALQEWPKDITTGCYMLLYERTIGSRLPITLTPITAALAETNGLKKAVRVLVSRNGLNRNGLIANTYVLGIIDGTYVGMCEDTGTI